MFRTLFANTTINMIAFAFTAFVSFLLVPLIVGRYGLTEFGLIMLARIMLPTGALAIFDFGFSEVATQAVAAARESGNWRRAGREIAVLAAIAVSVGVLVGALMAIFTLPLTHLFNVPNVHRPDFAAIILVSGFCFALFLPGMLLDGIVKGFEAFKVLRGVEVVCSVGYGVAALTIIFMGGAYAWIAYAYIVSMLVRAAALGGLSFRYLKGVGMRLQRPDAEARAHVTRRCRLFAGSKLLGASETQAAPLLIGALISPAAVGLYDISIRFPRFLKTVLSMLNTAVLPLASRLDSSGKMHDLSRLASVGMLTTAIIAFPICMWGAAFSEPILRVWLGQGFAHLWFWQAVMFAVPMFNTVASFGSTTLLGRPHVIAKMNTVMVGQLVLQFSIGFAFQSRFGGQAFVLGQALAFTAAFPFQMRIIARETGLPWKSFGRTAAVLGWQILLLAGCFLIGLPAMAGNLAFLAAAAAVWAAASYAIIWFLVLKSDERATMLKALRAEGFRTLIKPRGI